MYQICKGDELLLKTGKTAIARGGRFVLSKVSGTVAVPITLDEFELYVDVNSIKEIRRNGQPIIQQLELFEVANDFEPEK